MNNELVIFETKDNNDEVVAQWYDIRKENIDRILLCQNN